MPYFLSFRKWFRHLFGVGLDDEDEEVAEEFVWRAGIFVVENPRARLESLPAAVN